MRVAIHHPSGLGYDGAPPARSYTVRFHGYAKPVGMRVVGGQDLRAFEREADARAAGSGVVWDDAEKLLSVVIGAIIVLPGGNVAAVVEPSGAAFGVDTPRASLVPSTRGAPGCGCGIAQRSDPSRLALLALGLALC